ncbi:MAG: 30S ribosomal protein S7 [Thermodesulfobacteriota bacterium]
MPRKGSVPKRRVPLDSKYQDESITKFINSLMYDGKRSKAEKVFYGALALVGEKMGKDPVEIFNSAMDNIKPLLEVRPRRVGGATYQVPMEVNPFRRLSLSIRWVINAARSRQGKSMEEKLAGEFMDASQGRGGAVKKKEDSYKMAEANRAFAHYRW